MNPMILVDDARRLVLRRGYVAEVYGNRLVIYPVGTPGGAIHPFGSTFINGEGETATVSRHTIDKITLP